VKIASVLVLLLLAKQGTEASGEIIELGSAVSHIQIGQDIMLPMELA